PVRPTVVEAACRCGMPTSRCPASSDPPKHLVKTKLCKHFTKGYCRYEGNCTFAHQLDELVYRPDLTKTKWCARFLSGACNVKNCSFAHSVAELRHVDPARMAATEQEGQSSASCEFNAPEALTVEMSPLPVATMPTPPQHWFERPEKATTATPPLLQDDGSGEDAAREGFNVRARCRWTSVCIHLLLWKRRRLLRHGRILLSRSRQKLLRKEEVDEVSSMLLDDFTWLPEFVAFAHRCSRLLAERMEVSVEQSAVANFQLPQTSQHKKKKGKAQKVAGSVAPGVQTAPAIQYGTPAPIVYQTASMPTTSMPTTYTGGVPLASLPTSTWIQPTLPTGTQMPPAASMPMPTRLPATQYVYPAGSYPAGSYPVTSAPAYTMPASMPTTIVANPVASAQMAQMPQPLPAAVDPSAVQSGVESNASAPQLVQAAPTPTNTPVMQSIGTGSPVMQSLGAASPVMQSLGPASTPVMQSQSPMAQSFVVVGTPQAQAPMLTSLPAGSPVASGSAFGVPSALPATNASIPLMDPAAGATQQESEVKTQSKDLRKPGKKPKKGKSKFGCCGC
ncbi:unnamed protein product, partial [Symbiodinium microadriaticum]